MQVRYSYLIGYNLLWAADENLKIITFVETTEKVFL